MATALKLRQERLHPPEGRDGSGTPSRPKSFALFLKAIKERDFAALDSYQSPFEKVAMSGNTGVTGGYLVPEDYTARLLQVVAENSIIYPRAAIVPMKSKTTVVPTPRQETVQAAGTSPFFGGVLLKWGSEKSPEETEPTFNELNLTAWDLIGYAIASNQFMQDIGPEADPFFFAILGKAAAWYMEYAFFRGTGTANEMPLGVVNAPCTLTASRAAPNTIAAADISEMASKLMPAAWMSSIWCCNPTCLDQIAKLSTYQLNSYATPLTELGHVGFLVGRPLFVTDKLPALGTLGDIVLFDPGMYVVGDRQQVIVDVSTHDLFRTNQTVLRTWMRIDGKPRLSNSVTLSDATTQVSCCVALAA